ncbi:Neutral amino acid transporter b, partial [Globisporangium splendens]
MNRSGNANRESGEAVVDRGSGNSATDSEGRPKIVLYSSNSVDDEDAHSEHSELDLGLYETDDVPDSWNQQSSIGGEGLGPILSENNVITASNFDVNRFRQQTLREGTFDGNASEASSQRRCVPTYTSTTSSTHSSQNTRSGRMPMNYQPYIRTNFTTQDEVGTPSDPYEILGTPPGDPPSTQPDEMPTLEADMKTPRTMNPYWVFLIMNIGFAIGSIGLQVDLPSDIGYWLNTIGSLYIRAVNCVTLPMAFCQVVASVSALTAKNTLTTLWMRTTGVFLLMCTLSTMASMGIAYAFRPLMKGHESLGLTLKHPKFAFVCPNGKYFQQEEDGSLSCKGDAVQANTTFPWLVDPESTLGLDEDVSTVDITGYLFALFGTYVPNNLVGALAKDNSLSGLVIATVVGVAVTRSFRGLQSRSNPLLRLFMHVYSSLFSMLDWMQQAVFAAMVPMLIGSVLVNPDSNRIIGLTKYYCLSAFVLVVVHCFVIVPGVLFFFTRRNPYLWLYRVATPILYGVVLQSAFLPLSFATKAVMRTKEVPPAVFGAIFPPLCAVNRCAQAIGLPLGLMFVAAFSGCHIQVGILDVLKLFGVTFIACLGEADLGHSQLAYFLTIWRTICTNEDTPSAVLAIATVSLVVYRLSALANLIMNLAIVRAVADSKESKLHA